MKRYFVIQRIDKPCGFARLTEDWEIEWTDDIYKAQRSSEKLIAEEAAMDIFHLWPWQFMIREIVDDILIPY